MQNQNIKNKITISFTKSDDDLVEFLEDLKRKNKASEFIRDSIREKIEKKDSGTETNKEIMKEISNIVKRINSIEKIKEPFSDNLVVSKENRFGSPKVEQDIKKEESTQEKDSKSEELDGVLGFFDF